MFSLSLQSLFADRSWSVVRLQRVCKVETAMREEWCHPSDLSILTQKNVWQSLQGGDALGESSGVTEKIQAILQTTGVLP